ncbi:hypothetical protein ThvES_00010420 [Thiovulum sp. ES]|nr:hypothetical protein ThvES_00010420 [Thiovulum sp. ES]
MKQLSTYVYLDSTLAKMELEDNLIPNQYFDYPFLLIDNFLTEEESDVILQRTVENFPKKAKVVGGFIKKIRNVETYKVDSISSDIYFSAFQKRQKEIENFFSTPFLYGTDIQALGYKNGFFYKKHCDNSSEILDGDGNLISYKLVFPERKITTVLFLNSYGENFSGGELLFNYLFDESGNEIKISPKKGSMLVFPSNPIFSHEVKTVKSGFRLTFVQWHSILK